MINLTFKNVGQGDTILIDWLNNDKTHFGIVDCNLHDSANPLLNELISRKVKYIDFIILSHLHYDHYSGFAQLIEYCIIYNVKIGMFLHTFSIEYFDILSNTLKSQTQKNTTRNFLTCLKLAIKNNLIQEIDDVSNNFRTLMLNDTISLSFYSPIGRDYLNFSSSKSRYVHNNSSGSVPDFNQLSTIIKISNGTTAILLTSDSVKKSFKRIKNKIIEKIELIQVPHHGSLYNLSEDFWKQLKKEDDCPAVFSIGDVKKDQLPDIEVVRFFHNQKFKNYSTNRLYGIKEFYYPNEKAGEDGTKLSLALSAFSIKRKSVTMRIDDIRFSGDKSFTVLNS